MTLGMFTTMPQWLALPYCEAVDVTEVRTAKVAEQQAVLTIEDTDVNDGEADVADLNRYKKAPRQLIGGFDVSEEEKALMRRRLVCGCC